MEKTEVVVKKTAEWFGSSVSVKIAVIGFLLFVLLIPASMVKSLVAERAQRRDQVVGELSGKWGAGQTVSGPILTVPFRKHLTDNQGNPTGQVIAHMHFLPQKLSIDGVLQPEVRYRGIYEAVLYTARLRLSGSFAAPRFTELGVAPDDILWSQATLAVGLSDLRGIRDGVEASANGSPLSFQPGTESPDLPGSGIHARLDLSGGQEDFAFELGIELNGSGEMFFSPAAETTAVSLRSDWPAPSFTGAFLPVERRIDGQGFQADWQVLHMNRNLPGQWSGRNVTLEADSFGVRLFSPTDVYQKTTRTVKYAVLFMVLTFAAFFLAEILSRRRLHPVQYLMVGFALVLFYTLLLSVSEHLDFDLAYLFSSLATVGLVGGYARGILGGNRQAAFILATLGLLYGYLYIVLQLEDYALLIGSLGLFGSLGLVMYFTRHLDWYAVRVGEESKQVALEKE